MGPTSHRWRLSKLSKPELAAIMLWGITLLAMFLRIAFTPNRNTVFTTFEDGGASWLAGANLYTNYRGFVYSPLAAAFFAPFTLLPPVVSDILWRLFNVAIYLGAVAWWLKAGLQEGVRRKWFALVLLLLLPLSIGNLNNGQVNPMIIGLLMIALVAASRERWDLAAFCIAVTTYFKIYPLAVGLVLVVLFPKKFAWRLFVALLVLGALAFLLQRPPYVLAQYRLWFVTRANDNRKLYKMSIAPRDLWMLLHLVHLFISERLYAVIQLFSGAAIAMACLFGRWRGWTQERLFGALLSLTCAWMLLCGPATESATYIILAPAVVLALVQAFSQSQPFGMRIWIVSSYVVLLFALQLNSFFHSQKTVYNMSIQPAAALLFAGYALAECFRPHPELR